jgi:hypothetical protein
VPGELERIEWGRESVRRTWWFGSDRNLELKTEKELHATQSLSGDCISVSELGWPLAEYAREGTKGLNPVGGTIYSTSGNRPNPLDQGVLCRVQVLGGYARILPLGRLGGGIDSTMRIQDSSCVSVLRTY